jgi:hypothetical protein
MTDDVTLVVTAPLTGKGGHTRLSMGDGYTCVAEWMKLRSYTDPLVFRIGGQEVMRFDTDGEIIIGGKARATSREAFGCLRAWMMWAKQKPDADDVFVSSDGEIVIGPVRFTGDRIVMEAEDVTPEDAALAIIKWVLG